MLYLCKRYVKTEQRKERFMPMFVTIPIDVPPTLSISQEVIARSLTMYAQEYVDNLARQQAKCPTMSFEELEQCIPLHTAFDSLREQNHQYYTKA